MKQWVEDALNGEGSSLHDEGDGKDDEFHVAVDDL